ncbi:hypothetical protein [Campylobacter gastrosuis]|uniref:Uncharacterized protein n=1 Tax=Campylobacter gastrosuis TaxID=2974576 RepID=A0ABT7HPD3_9BACT|nr:hypothetical protein [Campylobacter gastrosuis]MDL0088761.1 hypothetical protein [Campylobacter gastrosuis]
MNFDHNDLEQIDEEIKGLNKDFKNFYRHRKHIYSINKKIIELRKSFLENDDIKYFLEKLDKYEGNVNQAKNFIEKYQTQDSFKRLLEIQQNQILQIKFDLDILKENGIYSIKKSIFKNRVLRSLKILRVLKDQKKLVKQHIKSKSIDEQKSLKMLFLKNESIIYEIYKSFSGKLYANFDKRYIEHINNAIQLDVFKAYNWIRKNIILSFWICVFFGACFCVPYFFNIGQIPQTDLSNIIYLLFGISILAFLYIGYTIVFLMAYGYAIFKNNTENKIISFIFWIMQICMLVICALPFAYDFEKLKWICNIILENFNQAICIYILLFVIYFGFGVYKNKTYKDITSLPTLFFSLCFDFLLILFVYKRYQDINFLFLLLTFFLLIFIKAIACLKTFEYKYIFLFSVFVGFAMMPVLSSDFVRIIKLANYKDSFTIKNEFMSKEILEKIPVCLNDYNATCIDKTTSDENKTTINNLLVKVKFDDRYYFKAHIPKDENLTTVSQKENSKSFIEFKIKKDNILN